MKEKFMERFIYCIKPQFILCMLFLFSCFSTASLSAVEEKPMVVVIASYKNKQWYKKNLNSVFSQKYSNYRVIYTDDCSPDGTGNYVSKYLLTKGVMDKCTLIKNEARVGALANDYRAIHSCDDEEIIVILDGDDWFAHDEVLKSINEAYISDQVWLTHGKFIHWPHGYVEPLSKAYPKSVIESNSYRKMNSPLPTRTFYTWLFKKIRVEDLMRDRIFFTRTRDAAMMYPLIEMAAERHVFIDDINYIYNRINSISDCKQDPKLQKEIADYIQYTLPPYKRLIDRFDTP
jgi:glycosyltransferase involved in cell wall biosynthesis